MNIIYNRSAIEDWAASADAKAVLAELGEAAVADAKALAPRDTGAMAESIHYEIETDSQGAVVKVSFDEAHAYGIYPEVGTSRMSAQPFLRPAITKQRNF